LQFDRPAALELLRRSVLHVVVANGRRHDDDARSLPAIEHRRAHLMRSFNQDRLSRRWRRERRGPADENHLRAATQRRFCQSVTHLAAGAVANVAHRIHGFVRRSGGNQDRLAREILRDAEAIE
jgi:hypothetical protein